MKCRSSSFECVQTNEMKRSFSEFVLSYQSNHVIHEYTFFMLPRFLHNCQDLFPKSDPGAFQAAMNSRIFTVSTVAETKISFCIISKKEKVVDK